MALTFDDGPDPDSTPALLDFLKEAGVQATFFCVCRQVEAHPEIAAPIAREGHALANHSFSHSHLTNFFTEKRLREELQRTQDAIHRAAGVVPTLFRPPMGLSNPRVFGAARALGISVVGWSARGFDTIQTNPDRVVARIVRQLRPGGVILMHDGTVPPARLLPAVKRLLDTLRTLGYEVVRFDRMQA